MLTPTGCHEQIATYGHITLNGILIQGLVDTGASVSCLAHSTRWQHRATWGVLRPYHQVIRGANGKPLSIAGQMRTLLMKWGSATSRSSFVVIMGLACTPALIGIDLIVPLQVQIDAASCTAILQPMHTLQAQEDMTSTATSACVSNETATQPATTTSTSDTTGMALAVFLHGVNVLAEFVCFVQVANPWPSLTVCFEPCLKLPLCVSSTPIVASGPAVWVALHNHRTEPVLLNAGHRVGTIEERRSWDLRRMQLVLVLKIERAGPWSSIVDTTVSADTFAEVI